MKTVGSYELKTHLAEILDEVAAGTSILVTRNGEPVAELVPHVNPDRTAELLARLSELRKRTKKVTLEELLAWRHEGHRY